MSLNAFIPRPSARTTRTVGAASLGLVALLSACKPVTGNKHDTSPPKISFAVAGSTVPNEGSYDVFGVGYQIVVTAHDKGGIDSIETSLVNDFVCTDGTRTADETDTNPQSMKGYEYVLADHTYFAHRSAPDDFWPDTNNNGVKDVAERALRYDELVVVDDATLVQQSFDAYAIGSACLMPDGVAGTVAESHLFVYATARNVRSEVAAAPETQTTTSTFIQLT